MACCKLLTEQNIVLMHFCTEGGCTFESPQKKPTSFRKLEHNILFIPKGALTLIPHGKRFNYIHIYIREEFFLRYVPDDRINGAVGSTKMFVKNLFINPRLRNILNEIATCEFQGHLKWLYTKAKMIELLSLQFVQNEEERTVTPRLKSAEIEKMIAVKELVESNLDRSHSIASLARIAGTNEQYLKKHFKILFGNTVFQYILSCKMQKAKSMLLTGKYRVTEIAELVGYKHATHFTTAFKKFFGYLPQTLKVVKLY